MADEKEIKQLQNQQSLIQKRISYLREFQSKNLGNPDLCRQARNEITALTKEVVGIETELSRASA